MSDKDKDKTADADKKDETGADKSADKSAEVNAAIGSFQEREAKLKQSISAYLDNNGTNSAMKIIQEQADAKKAGEKKEIDVGKLAPAILPLIVGNKRIVNEIYEKEVKGGNFESYKLLNVAVRYISDGKIDPGKIADEAADKVFQEIKANAQANDPEALAIVNEITDLKAAVVAGQNKPKDAGNMPPPATVESPINNDEVVKERLSKVTDSYKALQEKYTALGGKGNFDNSDVPLIDPKKKSIVVDPLTQTLYYIVGGKTEKIIPVSLGRGTGKAGDTGTAAESYETPPGNLLVLDPKMMNDGSKRPALILDGLDDENKNSKERAILLHPTKSGSTDGKPESKGCITMSTENYRFMADALKKGVMIHVIKDTYNAQKTELFTKEVHGKVLQVEEGKLYNS